VIETKAFKNMTKMQQVLFSKRNNIASIEHGVNLLKNIGREKFEKEHNFSYFNKLIIFELSK
jgi:hypothetical protein